jgi:hypothetical protein
LETLLGDVEVSARKHLDAERRQGDVVDLIANAPTLRYIDPYDVDMKEEEAPASNKFSSGGPPRLSSTTPAPLLNNQIAIEKQKVDSSQIQQSTAKPVRAPVRAPSQGNVHGIAASRAMKSDNHTNKNVVELDDVDEILLSATGVPRHPTVDEPEQSSQLKLARVAVPSTTMASSRASLGGSNRRLSTGPVRLSSRNLSAEPPTKPSPDDDPLQSMKTPVSTPASHAADVVGAKRSVIA